MVIEEEEEEEMIARTEFKEANHVNLNHKSVTIKIPTSHADAWKETLKNTIGITADRSKSNNGIQFKSNEGINITLWKKEKEQTSTIMIDGKKGFWDFLEHDMPKLYSYVKKAVYEEFQTVTDRKDKKRKRIELPLEVKI